MNKDKNKPNLVSNDLTNSLKNSVFARKIEYPPFVEPSQNDQLPETSIELETNNTVVAPQPGTTAPQYHNVAPQPQETEFRLDIAKLKTIVEEISQIETKRDGLNVRLSDQESQDIEDFIHDKLRRSGLKGYDVSAAKLMRYAFRYISRVHEKDFIKALELALKSESNLSI
jgi:hypothetical protein